MTAKHSLENIINISREYLKIASLNDAFIETAANKLVVKSEWSQCDIEKNERTRFQRDYLLELDPSSPKSQPNLVYTSHPETTRNNIFSVKSPNKEIVARVFNWKDGAEDKQFLEVTLAKIWKNGTRTENINLTKLDKHSKIYEKSSLLGSFEWSADSTKIAYIAEIRNAAKEKCLFTGKVSDSKDDINENNYEQKYAHFMRNEWGEQHVGKSESVIALFDVPTNELRVLEDLPADYAPAQITWNNSSGFVFSAYCIKPFRLGLVYCPIRRSELFYYDIENKKCTQLTDFRTEAVRCPNFSHDCEWLCWLQNQAKGAHFQCSKIMMMNWKTKEIKTLVDIVRNYPENDDDFPGIFADSFRGPSCWSLDNNRILVNTQWKKTNRLISIDIETKKVTKLDKNLNENESCSILRLENDWICAVTEGYNKPPSLMIAKLPKRGNEDDMNWTFIEDNKSLAEFSGVELLKFTPNTPSPKYPNVGFEAILVQPKNQTDTVIVFPHGGPHSSFAGNFSPYVTAFNSLGFAVLLLNYRGSRGYGQDSIECLPGFIGNYDVKDCQQAAEFVSNKYGFKNHVLFGGSHGGFLTTQLIGQYPDFYQAAVARNPVTHLESMLPLTDTPDWVVYEGTDSGDYDHKLTGNPELLKQLHERSPMSHIDKVKTPTLLLVGMVDLRVPPSQSYTYHKALLARNVPTKMIGFKEDYHSLDRPQTLADCLAHSVLWFEKYIK